VSGRLVSSQERREGADLPDRSQPRRVRADDGRIQRAPQSRRSRRLPERACGAALRPDVVKLDARSGEPLTQLRAGDAVELSGRLLTLRDASAARLARAVESGDRLPVSLEGQILYAVGPSPAKPGQIIGSAGPTTTARMARYFPALFASGVRA